MAKKEKKKRVKKTLTYAQAHNRALRSYQRASRIMIWGGVFNIFGLMLGLIYNAMMQTEPTSFLSGSLLANTLSYSSYQFSFCFASNNFIIRIFEMLTYNRFDSSANMPFWAFIVLSMLIVFIFSALAVGVSIYASQGKRWAFLSMIIFYFIDSAFIIFNYLIGEATTYLWILIALHVIIWFFLIMAIYQYYHLFYIEKIYKQKIAESDTISKAQEGQKISNENEHAK